MCGRYILYTEQKKLEKYFPGLEWPEPRYPRYNIAPGTDILTVTHAKASMMLWGLVPHWSKEPRTKYKTINARINDIETKASYRMPIKRQRCLIPANGYYEWQKNPNVGKQPYCIHMDGELFAFAAVWDRWHKGDVEFTSCSVCTGPADKIAWIHSNSRPIILPQDTWSTWLDPDNDDVEQLKQLCLEHSVEDQLMCRPVSSKVNNPDNDDPSLIEEVPIVQSYSGR